LVPARTTFVTKKEANSFLSRLEAEQQNGTSIALTNFHFHDLRQTGNTLAAMTGASTRELMSRMGHASPRAALIYQHATRERDAEIAARLGAMFDRQPAIPTSPEQGHASTKLTD
jgi:integrase